MKAIPITGLAGLTVVALLTACDGGSTTVNSAVASASSPTDPDKQEALDEQALSLAMDTFVAYTGHDTPTVRTVNLDDVKSVASHPDEPFALASEDADSVVGVVPQVAKRLHRLSRWNVCEYTLHGA